MENQLENILLVFPEFYFPCSWSENVAEIFQSQLSNSADTFPSSFLQYVQLPVFYQQN